MILIRPSNRKGRGPRKGEMLSNRSALSELLSLAWPAVLQGLLLTVVFLTDRTLLGHYHADGLGVVQICGPALWSLFSLSGSLDIGALALMGRARGRGDDRGVINLLRSCSLFSFGIGTLIFALSPWLTEWLIMWMGRETPELHQSARLYFFPLFLSAPLKMLGGLFFSALQSQGDTKTPMWISGVCGFTNLGLSALLIYGWGGAPELGIAGAAWGSAFAFTLQAALGGWSLSHRFLGLFSWRKFSFDYSIVRPVLKVTRGVLGERLGYHSAFLLFSSLIAGLGKVEMGAHQVLLAVESIGFIGADAFGVASSALVAQSMGRDDLRRAQKVGWLSALVGGGLLLSLSVIFLCFPAALIGCVTSDPKVISVGVPCLQIAAIAQPLMAVTSALAGALRGAGETRSPLIASLLGPAALRLGFCWLFTYQWGWGLLGIWAGSTIDWFGRSLYLAWAFHSGRWRSVSL